MPQTVDPLSDRLGETYRRALREFITHYEVEIISCALWRNRAPWTLAARRCPDTFLLIPLRGRFRAILPTGSRVVAPGSYLALADGHRHALAIDAGCRRLEHISIHCRIQDRSGRTFLSRFDSPTAPLRDPARWHRDFADLVSLMTTDPEVGQKWGRLLVRELIADRLRKSKSWPPLERAGDPRIEHVLKRMKDNLASPGLSIELLADEIDITATQLRKLFRHETRSSPKRYLDRLRLERAAYLLRHANLTVREVAREVGFATDNYFHLVFRKAYGVTPAAFRNTKML